MVCSCLSCTCCLTPYADCGRARSDDVFLHLDRLDAYLDTVSTPKPDCLQSWLEKWIRHLDELVEEELLLDGGMNVDNEIKIMVCCKVILRLVGALESVLYLYLDYLVVLMPRIVSLLLRDNHSTTANTITSGTVVCVMRHVAAKTAVAALPFIMSLLPLLDQESISVDVLVEVSCAVGFFVSLSDANELHKVLEPKALSLLRIFETALSFNINSLPGSADNSISCPSAK